MKLDMTKFLQAVSLALDLSALGQPGIDRNHSRRVAYISMMIAEELDFSYKEKCDLFANAILHDNGFVTGGPKKNKDFEEMSEHCTEGEANILNFPVYKRRENIIKYHHENYDGTGIFGISNENVHIFSHIIRLSDRLDVNCNLTSKPIYNTKKIMDYVRKNSCTVFHPDLVNALLTIMKKPRFWFDLNFYNIDEILDRVAPENILELPWKEVVDITDIFKEIIDSKSRFTHRHTKGLVDKISMMCDYYNIEKERRLKLTIAGNLHDLGKLYIPNSILDKPGKLEKFEFTEIKHHPYYTKLALDKIPGFKEISSWAANHHEKLNGKGYPEGYTAQDLDFESRLLSVLDIYQALEEDRPYRKGMAHEKIINILTGMSKDGFIDSKIVQDVIAVMENKDLDIESKKKSVVVVDDDKITLKLLNIYIEKKGLRVLRASTGKELLDILSNESPHIIFLDINMPGTNGFKVAKKVRKIEEEKELDRTIIIGMSADEGLKNKIKSLNSGMDDYIKKPFDKNLINKVLENNL